MRDVRLDVLVENLGHINYGFMMGQMKGFDMAKIYNTQFFDWDITSLPMDNFDNLDYQDMGEDVEDMPTFFKGSFNVTEMGDTFLQVKGADKGFVIINGFNLGRFYNSAKPQGTLYVPATCLKEGKNEILVFASDIFEKISCQFHKEPIWSSVTTK